MSEHTRQPGIKMSMIDWLVIHYQYVCWNIEFWMGSNTPMLPRWLGLWLFRRFDPNRHFLTREQIATWKRITPGYVHPYQPLPWYIGVGFTGPFVRPWRTIRSFFRSQTGGRSHRCEFTDPEHGALYGHREGAFMNQLFETFIANISDEDKESDGE